MAEGLVTENRLEIPGGVEENVAEEDKVMNPEKRFWRSASWSSSHSAPPSPRAPPPGTSFRQNSNRNRPVLPPLQTSGRNDEGKDCWAPLTPRREINRMKNGLEIKLDLAAVQRCRDSSEPTEMQMKRDKFAFFEKECSRVAEHIYLGSDAVARNRETLLANKITHVLNCVGFICKEYFRDDFKYNTLWLQDSPSEDITSILYDVFDYFEEVRELGGRVFVHCCQGVSRSTALVIAYLMWREGRSFEDAFQDVKAARGITNPNMGFACQLLQAQKRVHASPASPNSILRMYRMAPHSPYDALHLVPKTINNPRPSALDSRGAFVIQIPSAIFVWVGRSCEAGMARLAKAAAGQVVRYERAQAAILSIAETKEPAEFWEAFSKGVNSSDNGEYDRCSDEMKRVGAYDSDFDLYHRALQGVVPASGAMVTHIPARDSGWSRLRKKFFSGSVREKASSAEEFSVTRGSEKCKAAEKFEAASHSSPSEASSSHCRSFSLSSSPSPSSSYSWSPASSEESSDSGPSLLRFPSLLSSGKGSSDSSATRRGGMSPSLFLGNMADDPPPTPRFGKSNFSFNPEFEANQRGGFGDGSSETPSPESEPGSGLMEIEKSDSAAAAAAVKEGRIYEWPRLEAVDLSGSRDLNSSSVYIVLDRGEAGEVSLFIWIGRNADDGFTTRGSKTSRDGWQQIGTSFLKCMRLHSNEPAHVVKEGEEPAAFWKLFCSS